MRFLNDTACLVYSINEPATGMRSTYRATDVDHSGHKAVNDLMNKIKEHVKRYRIRLGEFFQDHDPLRKGHLEATKFRTTLYGQKLQLTTQEYILLENHFRDTENPSHIRYADFNHEIEKIFTENDLEKFP